MPCGACQRGCAAVPQTGVGLTAERKCSNALPKGRVFYYAMNTDLLKKCALIFNKLTGYQYRFILGRKGKLVEIVLSFSDTDFHHLVGLHKLKDLAIARDNRSAVLCKILSGQITYNTIEKSAFSDESRLRLEAFQHIENLLDGEQIIFRYNQKAAPYSNINGDYLLKMGDGATLAISFLFIDKNDNGVYFCRSFFPMEQNDYSKNQAQYTLLKKEKINLATGDIEVQYVR